MKEDEEGVLKRRQEGLNNASKVSGEGRLVVLLTAIGAFDQLLPLLKVQQELGGES